MTDILPPWIIYPWSEMQSVYFGPFLLFFGYLSCAIFFSPPMEGAGGCLRVGVSRVLGSLVSWGRILWEVRIRWLPGMSLVSLHNHSHILPCNGIYDNLKDTYKDKYKGNVFGVTLQSLTTGSNNELRWYSNSPDKLGGSLVIGMVAPLQLSTIHHSVAKTTCFNLTQSPTPDKSNLIQLQTVILIPSLCIISGIP